MTNAKNMHLGQQSTQTIHFIQRTTSEWVGYRIMGSVQFHPELSTESLKLLVTFEHIRRNMTI